MLTAELIAPREFRIVDRTLPPPAPGEVQVRVHSVGICGSDLHAATEGHVGDTPCLYPMVLGHEPSGTVEAIGNGVTGWSAGDRVALEPALYCYHCEYCRSGHHNVCASIRFYSNPGEPGFFRERMNLPAVNLLALPEGLALEAATLVEPLAIALHSMKIAGIRIGETTAVFGAGPIGLLTIACLKVAGSSRIFAVEPVAARREMALRMGADVAIDPGQTDAVRDIRASTGGRGVDCAIDCAARVHTTNLAIRAARNAGRVALTGIHSEVLVPFDVSHMRRQELAILNVRRSNHESHDALDLLRSRIEWFAPLITHTRPLDRIAEAFRLNEHYEDGVGKLVIHAGA